MVVTVEEKSKEVEKEHVKCHDCGCQVVKSEATTAYDYPKKGVVVPLCAQCGNKLMFGGGEDET